jgi:hypothetical protein
VTATATFPTSGAYVDALQDTARCFPDPELAGCVIRTDKFGLPRPISGNFASVFTAETVAGRRLAVKCFTRDVPDQQARFREIEAALRDVPARWKVEFRYVESGVLVRGRTYPVLVMEWIEARQLISWIEDRLRVGDRAALGRVADGFAELVAGLEGAGLAHGDLQHGNLLVTPRGELKLIDYDGMYVPALRDRPAMELGQPNYQHPRRTVGDYGPWLDRFSARVIHLSLTALATDPALWHRLHKPGGEYLLLQKYDLEDLATSPNLASLASVSDALRAEASDLAEMARRSLDAIPPLTHAPQGAAANGLGAGFTLGATAPTGPFPPAATSGSWLDDHRPPPPPVRLARPSWMAHVAWYFSTVVACLSITAAVFMPFVAPGTIAVLVIVLLSWQARFTVLPETRARRAQRKSVRAVRTEEKQHAAQLRWQLAARQESIDTYQRELRALADRRAQIDAEAATEYARIDRWRDQELAKLVRERTHLQSWKNTELSRRTAFVEARHIGDELARHRIDVAQIYGIGRTVVAELDAAGIRTAADFHGIQIHGGFGQSKTVLILHRDGRALKVAMVGESRAKSLDRWREGLIGRARSQMPAQLTAPIRAQVEAEAAQRQAGITTREASVKSAAEVQRRTAHKQTQEQRESLIADEQSTRSSHAAAVAAIDRDCALYRDDVADAERRLQAELRALDAYKAVRFRRYLLALTTGRT